MFEILVRGSSAAVLGHLIWQHRSKKKHGGDRPSARDPLADSVNF